MSRTISIWSLALILAAAAACSADPAKKEKAGFIRKMEQESEAFAKKKMEERARQEARNKQQWEEYRKRMEEEAARAATAVAPPVAAAPASSTDDVQIVLSDKDLTFVVLNKIRLMQHRSTISVECKDGVVKLFGEAESAEVKQRLVSELKKLPGVRRVDASELYLPVQ